jgi:DNA-binding CsgD family transcriptional regulator/FtsH-binding integral membrane protein
MRVIQLCAYVAGLVLAALSIVLAFRLSRTPGRKYLQAFFFFVVVNEIMPLTDIIFRYLPSAVILVPAMALLCYAFIVFFLGLVRTGLSAFWKRIYWGSWGLFLAAAIVAEFLFFNGADKRLLDTLIHVFDLMAMASFWGVILLAMILRRRLPNATEKKLAGTLGVYYAVCMAVFYSMVTSFGPIRLYVDAAVQHLFALSYNLPAILFLASRLKRNPADSAGFDADPAGLAAWLEGRGVSKREQEVVRLLLQGKSNKAIEQELFISRRTVETHLYNVFRKLGVKSRMQLARLAAERPGGPFFDPPAQALRESDGDN